jgi:hypothetical protein
MEAVENSVLMAALLLTLAELYHFSEFHFVISEAGLGH